MIGNIAMAQDAVQTASTQPAWMQFFPFIIIFVVFYFLMIRPAQKKMKQEQAMLGELKKGDEIYTKSGILGTIAGMTDRFITLEVDSGVKFKILRSQIGGLASQLTSQAQDKK